MGANRRTKAPVPAPAKAVSMCADYLKDITPYNVRRAEPQPGRCALLVIDMQAYFQTLAASILDRVRAVIEYCRSRQMPVIFTRHGHKDVAADGGMLAAWWGDLIGYGSEDWALIRPLSDEAADLIIDKQRYSAFHGTDLDERLRSWGIGEVIITGVMTNCCCETTARDAFVRDYRVFFISDATATVNDELHLASLKNLAFGFAHILSTAELCRDRGRW
jgi:isochorismate hydrolase